jgi:serine protease Do
MRLKPIAAALAAAGLLAAGGAGAWSLSEMVHGRTAPATSTVAAATAAPTIATPAGLPAGAAPNYRDIVQTYGPAVVGVTVAGTRKVDAAEMPALPDDPFFQFFRGLPHVPFGPQGDVPFRGQGSGFIVSSDGLILTNAHVVRDAKEVMVKLSDRREFRAKVLGSDTATDVAVLKVDAKDLPVVALGDDKQVQVGDYVLAIGTPFGFEQTATQGIVSAKGRSLPGDSYVPFIQTDAAVNPGNSGGPLFDARGRVVGINAQIFSRSGGFQGLAFAIPIDVALHVKDEIVHHGKIEHARLGVTVQDLSQGLAESFGLKLPDGALVSAVMSGSAAARADLKPGDVITRIDGQPVRTGGDVSTRVGMASPGQKVQLTIWRDKASRDIEVKLGAAADTEATRVAADNAPGPLGLAVRPLTPDEKRQAHADHGLLVEDVGGAAAHAGIQPGDVVLSLNGKPIDSAEQIRAALDRHPGHLALLIQRDDQRIFVPINLG